MLVVYRGKITKICHCEPVTVCAALSAFLLLLFALMTNPTLPSLLPFFCLPSLCGKFLYCAKCACMLSGHAYTHLCSVGALLSKHQVTQ